jgi:hypothetical protein
VAQNPITVQMPADRGGYTFEQYALPSAFLMLDLGPANDGITEQLFTHMLRWETLRHLPARENWREKGDVVLL